MSQIKLYLFGTPRLERDGQTIHIRLRKAMALFAYLTVTDQPHSRDVLATLLWPEDSQGDARANLRRTLYRITQALGKDILTTTKETIACNPKADLWLDVTTFQQQVADGQPHAQQTNDLGGEHLENLAKVVELYTDDFMAGFTIPDSPAYDEWQFFQRESLEQALSHALMRLAYAYQTEGELELAIEYTRRWLALDPLQESVQRYLMQLYAQAGQQAAAIRQYEESVRILEEELGIAPEAETVELFEVIRTRRFLSTGKTPRIDDRLQGNGVLSSHNIHPTNTALTSSSPHPLTLSPHPPSLIPTPATPFVGRDWEVEDILHRLQDPTCRLLTLVGPGGIGKTRLSIEIARRLLEDPVGQNELVHAVHFVALQSVESPDHIISAMAQSIDCSFYGNTSPEEQLLTYLQDKRLLLVLDNFEHLLNPDQLSDGADLIATLLNRTQHVKLLVTSRQALGLQEEWFYPISGMRYPAESEVISSGQEGNVEEAEIYDAIQIFAQSAQRANPQFSLQEERAHVIRICQLVDGMPLGLELAAAWTRSISCAEIVEEIERSLDFLQSSLRNIPKRHRSLTAVFEQTWQRLSPEEQNVLCKLSIFQGGATREAAKAVADTTLPTLSSLVEQALLYRTSAQRYTIHELTRQYAVQRLQNEAEIRAKHSRYFGQFVRQCYDRFLNKEYRQALKAFSDEIDNIRAAWHWLIGTIEACQDLALALETLTDFIYPLSWFYRERALYREGKDAFEKACAVLELILDSIPPDHALLHQTQVLRARLQIRLTRFYYQLGEYERSCQTIEELLPFVSQANLPLEEAQAYMSLARICFRQGNYAETQQLAQRSADSARQAGSELDEMNAITILAMVAANEGDYPLALRLHQKAVDGYRRFNYTARMAQSLTNLACTYRWSGDCHTAQPLLQEARTIALEENNRFLQMFTGGNLAWVKSELDDQMGAQALFAESLTLAQEMGDQRWIAMNCNGLGITALRQNDLASAVAHARKGMVVAQRIGCTHDVLGNMACVGQAWARQGHIESALRLLLYAEHHPAMVAWDKGLFAPLLAELRDTLPAQTLQDAADWGISKSVDEVVQWIELN